MGGYMRTRFLTGFVRVTFGVFFCLGRKNLSTVDMPDLFFLEEKLCQDSCFGLYAIKEESQYPQQH